MKLGRCLLAAFALVLLGESASAECNLQEVVGYTLVAAKTVEGWIEDNEFHDGFEGCEHGRILVFTDQTGVVCTEYEYTYAYRPDAYVFVRGSNIKLCIDGDMMDAGPLR